jgi:hypothetical protein
MPHDRGLCSCQRTFVYVYVCLVLVGIVRIFPHQSCKMIEEWSLCLPPSPSHHITYAVNCDGFSPEESGSSQQNSLVSTGRTNVRLHPWKHVFPKAERLPRMIFSHSSLFPAFCCLFSQETVLHLSQGGPADSIILAAPNICHPQWLMVALLCYKGECRAGPISKDNDQ